MTRNPLVSIVLPTYNGGSGYLDQAVQSCLSQTYSNWELIIVDDGSTDDTQAQIARYVGGDGNRIRSVRHETNRGLPAGLNTGFAEAKGLYLTWTSDDNCYRPQALDEMVAVLESHPGIDIVYTDYSNIDDEDNLLGRVTISDPELLLRGNAIGPCFLYRRRVYEKIGGYAEDLFLAEDYDFWLRASIWFRLQPLHKDLYLYRRHGRSLTAKHQREIRLATEKALARNCAHMRWAGRTGRAKGYLRLAELARARHDKKRELEYLLRAMWYSPGLFVSKIAFGVVLRIW
ncbi:MAG: glycosyltransferase [bacterium]